MISLALGRCSTGEEINQRGHRGPHRAPGAAAASGCRPPYAAAGRHYRRGGDGRHGSGRRLGRGHHRRRSGDRCDRTGATVTAAGNIAMARAPSSGHLHCRRAGRVVGGPGAADQRDLQLLDCYCRAPTTGRRSPQARTWPSTRASARQYAVPGSGAFQPCNVGIGIAVAVVTLTRTVEATIGTGTTIAQGANLTPLYLPLTVNGRSYTGVAVHGEWWRRDRRRSLRLRRAGGGTEVDVTVTGSLSW